MAETINNYIKEGKLLPSHLVVMLLKNSISAYGNRRYLFDGFPRNQENWTEFEKQLGSDVVVRNLLYFDCTKEVLFDRLMERAKTSGRADDNPETINKRLETFENETLPIVKKFEEQNNCIKVNAACSREEVYKNLKCKLQEVHVHPPQPAFMIFVLGGPGSGKGTQCQMLVTNYGCIHLSTGDLLREQVRRGSNIGKQIDEIMKEGKLVSSYLMVKLVKQNIERNNYGGRYLLDGFPRGQQNMDVWQKQMEGDADLKAVLFFDCDQEELKKRLLKRGETSGRSDDNQQSIKKRLDVFNEQTKPVIKHYETTDKLQKINANETIENIQLAVEKALNSIGVFPLK